MIMIIAFHARIGPGRWNYCPNVPRETNVATVNDGISYGKANHMVKSQKGISEPGTGLGLSLSENVGAVARFEDVRRGLRQ